MKELQRSRKVDKNQLKTVVRPAVDFLRYSMNEEWFGLSLFKKQNVTKPKEKNAAVLVCAGSGRRMNSQKNKLLIDILGRPLVSYTLEAFEACEAVDEIIIVSREEDLLDMKDIVDCFKISKAAKIVCGGNTRQESVYAGLCEPHEDTRLVAIHDGARPFVLPGQIAQAFDAAAECGGAVLAVPVKDSLKTVSDNGMLTSSVDRSCVYAVQTPQCFSLKAIKQAYEQAKNDALEATDDTAVAMHAGIPVKVVMGSYDNIKITTREDCLLAERILEERSGIVCE